MNKEIVKWMRAVAFGFAAILLISCDDSNEPTGKGNVQFEITDSPSDDGNITGVYVTVTDIKVDGRSIGGVTKATVNLKDYTEGATKVLALASQFDSKTYGSVTLVLDLNTDADGATPGCYVRTMDGKRYKLKNTVDGTTEVVASQNFEVASNTTTKVVLDFDIRKAISYDANDDVRYKFVGDDQLNSSLRVMVKEKGGAIKGILNNYLPARSEKVVAYAYKKGTFSASTETQPQGENQMYFMNAVASGEVKPGLNGRTFVVPFLEEGDYELYFASYDETPSGRLAFQRILVIGLNVNGTVGNRITVRSGGTVSVATVVSQLP
ncbi:MAG: DUF4382 domain-containing protein [Bacteroidota bacterium]